VSSAAARAPPRPQPRPLRPTSTSTPPLPTTTPPPQPPLTPRPLTPPHAPHPSLTLEDPQLEAAVWRQDGRLAAYELAGAVYSVAIVVRLLGEGGRRRVAEHKAGS
jgi:hypothetical protein